jgi:hypothetical protein
MRQVPGDLLVICNGQAVHRNRLLKAFVAHHKGRICLERLPANASMGCIENATTVQS